MSKRTEAKQTQTARLNEFSGNITAEAHENLRHQKYRENLESKKMNGTIFHPLKCRIKSDVANLNIRHSVLHFGCRKVISQTFQHAPTYRRSTWTWQEDQSSFNQPRLWHCGVGVRESCPELHREVFRPELEFLWMVRLFGILWAKGIPSDRATKKLPTLFCRSILFNSSFKRMGEPSTQHATNNLYASSARTIFHSFFFLHFIGNF